MKDINNEFNYFFVNGPNLAENITEPTNIEGIWNWRQMTIYKPIVHSQINKFDVMDIVKKKKR